MIARNLTAGIGLLAMLLPAATLYGQTEFHTRNAVQNLFTYELHESAWPQPVAIDNQDWQPRIRIVPRDFAERSKPSASLIPTRWNENVFQLIPTRWDDARVMLVPGTTQTQPQLDNPPTAMPAVSGRRLP